MKRAEELKTILSSKIQQFFLIINRFFRKTFLNLEPNLKCRFKHELQQVNLQG